MTIQQSVLQYNGVKRCHSKNKYSVLKGAISKELADFVCLQIFSK